MMLVPCGPEGDWTVGVLSRLIIVLTITPARQLPAILEHLCPGVRGFGQVSFQGP